MEEKPSKNEDEYFARRDAELMKDRRAKLDAERSSRERIAHYNKCPRCGADLSEREHHHVKLDECGECGGIWLDKGELDMMQDLDRQRPGFVGSLFGFRR
jgi:hypothetical protein